MSLVFNVSCISLKYNLLIVLSKACLTVLASRWQHIHNNNFPCVKVPAPFAVCCGSHDCRRFTTSGTKRCTFAVLRFASLTSHGSLTAYCGESAGDRVVRGAYQPRYPAVVKVGRNFCYAVLCSLRGTGGAVSLFAFASELDEAACLLHIAEP